MPFAHVGAASVADLLAYDALSEDTHKMIERVYADKLSDAVEEDRAEEREEWRDKVTDARQEGYEAGHADGLRAGLSKATGTA